MRNIGIIIAFMICCAGVAQVNVQQPPRVSGMGYGTLHDMPMFCEQLKYELTWPWSWRKKHGRMSFKRWRKAARAEVFKTMQTAPPAPVGYGYEVIACERRDGYEAQKIRFNVNRWERVVAYLLIPDAIPNSALRFPETIQKLCLKIPKRMSIVRETTNMRSRIISSVCIALSFLNKENYISGFLLCCILVIRQTTAG